MTVLTKPSIWKCALLASALIGLAGNALAAEKLVLGTIQSPTAPETKAAEFFAAELEKATDGRYKVNVVNSAQLGPAIEQYQNVQSGAQDMFLDDIGWNAQFVKDYGVLAVPFAINGPEGFNKVMSSDLADGWREKLKADHGLATLADTFIRSPRVVFTTSEVHNPGDLSGVKFRVPEIDVYFNSWQAIGVNPTPVPWGELYLALRQGVVNGGEGPFTTLLPTKFPEVAKFVLETNHLYSANTMIMNAAKFDALSGADKAAFQAAAKSAADYYVAEIAKFEGEHRATMKESFGVTFASPTTEARKQFSMKVAAAVPSFEEKGLWSAGTYEKVIAAQK
ncbi:MAG: TRAP transporter substrate-binding protein [Pseudomonadota bacterium]|nr:TRAP transporter substrate-binding protein [Pseudomonadota bacterium]